MATTEKKTIDKADLYVRIVKLMAANEELTERLEAVEHDLQAAKDGLAFHENRLNNLSLSNETVDIIASRTIRALGQLLLNATEPPAQQPPTELPTQEQEALEDVKEA